MTSPAQPDSWLGRSIGPHQRYRLEKRLGSGGMGDVFLAMDTLLGQQVALKLLKERLVASTSLRKRFEREVAICAALKSDHIVNVSDYGVTPEGYPFYVMEYLRGLTLKQLLQQQQRLSVERTVRIMTQVCEGLRLAHAGVTLWWNEATTSEHVKVVHRDLKPDNIFLLPTALGELAKILDFGIAKIHAESIERTNLTYGFIGTFRYAAPEQLRVAANLDERADIYSLGVILYEMLSSTDPFGFGVKAQNATGMSWAMAHKTQSPVPLRLQPGCEHLSPQLEAVVMQCLQKQPDQRFASVEELKQALQAAVISGKGSVDTTVHQFLTPSKRRVVKEDSFQVSPSPGPGSGNTPVNKPLLPERQDATSSEILTSTPPRSRRLPISVLSLLGIGIGICAVTLGTIIYTYNQYNQSRLEAQVLDDIKSLKTKAEYEECTTKAETVDRESRLYAQAQSLLNECQLEHAKHLADGNNFAFAIAAAQRIPEDSPLYSQAQALIREWSEI